MTTRYIADVLPLGELNKYAQKGGGIGSLNAMHPYFARRPLTASRAMTLAALIDAPSSDTERKAFEEALQEADRCKDEFLAMLAHELRNPLTPILNAAQILSLTGADENRIKWSQAIIERQVKHLTRLVDELLDVSRIVRGKIELKRESLELSEVVGQAEEARVVVD